MNRNEEHIINVFVYSRFFDGILQSEISTRRTLHKPHLQGCCVGVATTPMKDVNANNIFMQMWDA